MKRLIAQIGLTYLSVLAVVFYMGRTCACVIGAVSLVAFVLLLVFKKSRETIYLPVIAFVALLSCVVNIGYTEFVYERIIDKYDGYNGEITATLIEEPVKRYGVYQYTFKTKSIGDSEDSVRISVLHNELLNIDPFDVVQTNVELEKTDNETLLSQKCFLIGDFGYGNPQCVVLRSEHYRPYYWAIKLRQCVREALRDVLDDDSFRLCSALLVGDKHVLGDETYQLFKRAGISHLVVVSGLHFSILTSLFMLLVEKYYRKRHIYVTICVAFVFLYMAVTGYTPSVVRSGVMMLVYCLGLMLSRETYSLNSLGLAAIVLTIANPYSVGDVGLILSFAASFAIIVFALPLYSKCFERIKVTKYKGESWLVSFFVRLWNKFKIGSIELICVNISVFVVTMPLSVLFFGATSIVSVIATVIMYLPIWALLYLTAALALVYYIPLVTKILTPVLVVCIEILAHFSLWLVELFASIPFAYLTVTNNFVYLWVLMYAVMFCMMLLCKNKTVAIKAFACSALAVFLTGYITSGLLNSKVANIDVFSVVNGTAIMYSDNSITAVLELDSRKSKVYEAVSKIEHKTNRVDFVSSVSDNLTSVTSLYALTKVFAISDILLYDTKRSVTIPDTVDDFIVPDGDCTVELGDNAKAQYIWTDEGYIIYLKTQVSTSLILPPFIDAKNIPETYRSADYIIINNSPLNAELLTCDTLIISADESWADNILKATDVCYKRALLTSDKDIEIVEVV